MNQNSNVIPQQFRQPYHFKCIQCGNCCSDKNTIVNLTYSDILRIHWDMGYNFNKLMEIIGFYIFEKELTEEQIKKMVIPPIITQNGPAFIALRKKENGTCIFLNRNKKCSIYPARPGICRTFPFHFHANPIKSPKKRLDINLNLAEKAIEYCEGFNEDYDEIDPEYWLNIGKYTVTDILKENSLINRWNQAVKEGKITNLAENYIKIILNSKNNEDKSSNKISTNGNQSKKKYKQRVIDKIKQKKEQI